MSEDKILRQIMTDYDMSIEQVEEKFDTNCTLVS